MKTKCPLVYGMVDKIGQSSSLIIHHKNKKTLELQLKKCNYFTAVNKIVTLLKDLEWGVIKEKSDIGAIGHRVVHGGEDFTDSVLITEQVLERIKFYNKLAPLHNPPAYNGIRATKKIFPELPQVAVFDTAFHQTMPAKAYMYAVPYELYTKYHVRRYGFHGTSHRYVASAAAQELNQPISKLKLITCHLGNGCSVAAVKYGKSIDTSMGFTPLEGLVMGTRCGDIDPALVEYIMEKEKLSIDEIDELMNRKSGLLGVSGISNDMRDLLKQAKKGNARAELAIDMFIYRLKKYIGAYLAVMDGADAIVLTAGIGENMPLLRKRLEVELKNIMGNKIKLLTIHTDEERLIALDTYALVKKK